MALSGVSNFCVFSFLMFFCSCYCPLSFCFRCCHSAFVTNPADVITTRIITQEVGSSRSSSSSSGMSDTVTNKPLGVIEMGQLIYDEGGPSAFLKGWQAR